MINMFENAPEARFRETYSARRIEDLANFGGEMVYPLDVDNNGNTLYETLPLKTEQILDLSSWLSRLVTRDSEGKYTGQTASREEILEMIDRTAYLDQGMVLGPSTKMIAAGGKSLKYCPTTALGRDVPLGTSSLQLSISGGLSNLTKNQVAQLYIRGWHGADHTGPTANTTASYAIHQPDTLPTAGAILGSGGASTFDSWAQSVAGAGYDTKLLGDWIALQQIHTSALSWMYQFRKELKKLSTQTQYMSSEMVGFYEKGLKGSFLRHYTNEEVYVMIQLVELGAAIRRARWTPNQVTGDTLNSWYCDININGEKYTAAPWWIAALHDRYHFTFDEQVDDVRDIHREDLFHGLKALFEAASLEYGAGFKSLNVPYLDFFEDMVSGTVPDLTNMDDLKAMKTLWHTGYSEMEQFFNREVPGTKALKLAFFRDMIKDGAIAQNSKLLLQQDFEQLDKLPCITGSRFKEGMQMCGKFEYTTEHRLTRFGQHSVDVSVTPFISMRPLKHWSTVRDNGEKWAHTSDYGVRAGALANDINLSEMEDMLNGTDCQAEFYTEWVAFPSLDKGWASLAAGMQHSQGHPWLGYGTVVLGETDLNQAMGEARPSSISVPSATKLHNPSGSIYLFTNFGGHTMFPEGYWRVGYDGIITSFVPVITEIYKHWMGRTSGLFRRSELKNLLSFPSYNLKSEMTMMTPDPLFANHAKEIFGIMGCGGRGYDPGITIRNTDRRLDDMIVHIPDSDVDNLVTPYFVEASSIEDCFAAQHVLGFLTGMYGPGLREHHDGIPEYGDITSMTAAVNSSAITADQSRLAPWIRLGLGAYTGTSSDKAVTGGSDLDEVLLLNHMRYNNQVPEMSYYPLLRGPACHPLGLQEFSSGIYSGTGISNVDMVAPTRASCFRTFYHTYKSLDGGETRVGVTQLGQLPSLQYNAGPLSGTIDLNALNALELAQLYDSASTPGTAAEVLASRQNVLPFFNYLTEEVETTMTSGTQAELLPGFAGVFETWRLTEGDDVVYNTSLSAAERQAVLEGAVSSTCTSFGTMSSPAESGSTLTSAIATKYPSLSSPPSIMGYRTSPTAITSVLAAAGAAPSTYFDNRDYVEYLELRSGSRKGVPSDVRLWRERAPGLFIYDQDVLDTDEGVLGGILYLGYRIAHPGRVTYAAVLNPNGEIGYEVRNAYSWGSTAVAIEAPEGTVTGEDTPPAVESADGL